MQEITLKLNAQQVQNLYNYLGRANISGTEAMDFVSILNTINQQFMEQTQEKEQEKVAEPL